MLSGSPALTASACAERTAFLICLPLRLLRRARRSRSSSEKLWAGLPGGGGVEVVAEVEAVADEEGEEGLSEVFEDGAGVEEEGVVVDVSFEESFDGSLDVVESGGGVTA